MRLLLGPHERHLSTAGICGKASSQEGICYGPHVLPASIAVPMKLRKGLTVRIRAEQIVIGLRNLGNVVISANAILRAEMHLKQKLIWAIHRAVEGPERLEQ